MLHSIPLRTRCSLLQEMHEIDITGARWMINCMGGIVADPGAFKLLFDDTWMSLDWNLIAERQTQMGQSTVRLLSKGTVKAEDAELHNMPGLITVPLAAIGCSGKVVCYDGVGEIDSLTNSFSYPRIHDPHVALGVPFQRRPVED